MRTILLFSIGVGLLALGAVPSAAAAPDLFDLCRDFFCQGGTPSVCVSWKCGQPGVLACVDGACVPDPCWTTHCF